MITEKLEGFRTLDGIEHIPAAFEGVK